MTLSPEFWKAWMQRKKDLRPAQPECSCGRKHPEKTLHEPRCPWLQFWDRQFSDFYTLWYEGKRTLDVYLREGVSP